MGDRTYDASLGEFILSHPDIYKGCIYLHPPTKKNRDGKLRLLYEAFPLAFLAEKAGCLASSGQQAILDVKPTSSHQRTPLYIGSPIMVDNLIGMLG